MPTKIKAVEVDVDLWKDIKKAAIDQNIPLTQAVDSALKDYLKKVTKK